MENKRILFIDLGSHYGGVESYLDGLSDILSENAKLYVICSLPKLAAQMNAKGARVTCVPILYSKWSKGLRLGVAFFLVPYYLLRYQIQTVQVNGYFESMLLPLVFLLGRTSIYTMHGPFETEQYRWYRNPERFFPRLVSKFCLRSASRVICVSETVGEIALRELDPRKVGVIPNWVSVPAESGKRSRDLKSPANLVFVGRLEQYKGVHLIIAAMREIPDVRLTVVGDGTFRGELEQLAKGLAVQFAGFQVDPAIFYNDADLFVNPSLGPEGLPLVSLEAMGRGIPCLFSDLPVHREISNDGEAAGLFKSGDAGSLAEQVKHLLGDEALRNQIAERAAAVVERKYSRRVAAAAYQETFGLR
jgi:glycosyltransferase involved in cell wall biosynthesis